MLSVDRYNITATRPNSVSSYFISYRYSMSSTLLLALLIASCAKIAHARSMNTPDQLMPFIFSSVNGGNTNGLSATNDQHRLIQVIEQIIK